jgi:N4-gp56 family major capsid protein
MSSFGINTYGDISPRVGMFAVANFLEHARPVLVLEKFARMESLPKNKGQMVKWRRFVPFEINTTALVEGVTPAPNQLQYEDVSSIVSQYGGWVPFTDVIVDTHEDPNLQKITMGLGEQAASIKEAIIWNELLGGTNVIYSGTATQRSEVEAPISEDVLVIAQRYLKANKAKPITRMLKASTNIATEPVAPAYLAFGHTNLEQDFRALNEFVVREKYSQYSPVSEYEIGKFQDIRVILSPQLDPFWGAGSADTLGVLSRDGANVDVYPILVVGADAFGVVPLRGMDSATVTIKNPTPTYEDPLAQRGFASWKMWYVAVRLNEEWMVRIEAAASA